jgi:hypothetical protein
LVHKFVMNYYVLVLLGWIFIFITIFLPFTFTIHKKTTFISVKVPENFDLHCTFIGSVVTFLVNDFRLVASNLCVYKYAVLVLLMLAEYWRNLSPWRCHADRWLFYASVCIFESLKMGYMCLSIPRDADEDHGAYIWPESAKEFVGTAYTVIPCHGVPTGLGQADRVY